MPSFRISGLCATTPVAPDLMEGLPGIGTVRPKYSAALQRARAGVPLQILEADDSDIVELELDGGLRVWMRADAVQGDFGLQPARDGGGPFDLPNELPVAGRSRGVGEWVIKGLKIFGVDLAGTITEFVSEYVEGKLQPGPGLYLCTTDERGPWKAVKGTLPGKGPALVFLHGTASSTLGSFGGLWEGGAEARIRKLLAHYDGRVLAFQHRTLSESPIENALAVATTLSEILPAESEIHLVSHSRGGMVGELLARANRVGVGHAFDNEDLDLFAEQQESDRKGLEKLNKVFAASRFKVGRFVRVACPARGTTLADGRLDRYFSVLTNLVGQISWLKENPIYDGLRALLVGVLKKRTDPKELPGLEAMMPGSALTLLLNRPDVRTDADLHVLGGDIAGEGGWSHLKALAGDLFFLDDHDLVVNTASMLGGVARRSGKIRYWIDTGPEVTHFNYFRRTDTAGRLVNVVTSKALPQGFRETDEAPSEVTSKDYVKRAGVGPQPVVFFLPGIMGSTLHDPQGRIWVDYWSLAKGGLGRLKLDKPQVEAKGVLASTYDKVLRRLSQTHEVVPFPYDWRRPLEVTAAKLTDELEKKVEEAERYGQPIRIMAHSMGGLVVRTMLAQDKGKKVWDRLCKHQGARFIMLGTPNGGAYAIAAMLMGRDTLARQLALLDVKHSRKELLEIIGSFDGVLNLLPHPATGSLDLLDAKKWEELHQADAISQRGLLSADVAGNKSANVDWPMPNKKKLDQAQRVAQLLKESPVDPTRMIYVAGCAPETACDITIDPAAPEDRRVTVHATVLGDGRVPWSTGIPEALKQRAYYMNVVHGDLASAEEHFPALEDLLLKGATTKLMQSAPARRGGDQTFPLRFNQPSMVPDAEDVMREALGGKRRWERAEAKMPRVRVRVMHGNLTAAEHPVVVGHYDKDVMVSAERHLDDRLDGRLSDLYRMGIYPGAIATATAVLNDKDSSMRHQHPGAVVVGLGQVGDLTPGSLTQTLVHGLTVFGAERLAGEHRRRQRPEGAGDVRETLPIRVTMLLIGSGEGGVSLIDSLQAILRAVGEANIRFERGAGSYDGRPENDSTKDDGTPGNRRLKAVIEAIDILELFEDRAIQAQRVLNSLASSPKIAEEFHVQETLESGRDGARRATGEEGAGWWQRVRITVPDGSKRLEGNTGDALCFEAITTRAGAPSFLQPTQRGLVDNYLRRAKESTRFDDALGKTLFDMLVPSSFKRFAPDRSKLAVVVDEKAARYPWELLHDRYDHGGRPLSVETAMIRQLLLTDHDTRPSAGTDNVLVIGNPLVADKRYPTLPGAEAEARAVAGLLDGASLSDKRRLRVTSLFGADADPLTILDELPQEWRILHIAAHGEVNYRPNTEDERAESQNVQGQPGDVPLTGVVLADDVILTPAMFHTMVRYVPDLVFINCCHLGDTSHETGREALAYHQFAANVATQFIRLGARAVVAAGWAVDDRAAKQFAIRFYEVMLQKRTFGEAVHLARQAVYETGTNTWGAYQCYGEPDFRLELGDTQPRIDRLVAAREAVIRFENIAQQAEAAGNDEKRQSLLRSEIADLLSKCPDDWQDRGDLCAAVGAAYANLGDFDLAIAYYDKAKRAAKANVSLEAIEQLANLRARRAAQLDDSAAQVAMFDEAEADLRALLAISDTGERRAMLGSLNKRRAMRGSLNKPGAGALIDVDASLKAMAEAYECAFQIKTKRKEMDAWYPLANKIAAEVVLALGPKKQTPRAKKSGGKKCGDLADLERMADEVDDESTNFWELCLPWDFRLLKVIHSGKLTDKDEREIAEGYRNAVKRGGSERGLRSVEDQIRFFEILAAHKRCTKLATDLERLRKTLKG